jgi:hypothetical protein
MNVGKNAVAQALGTLAGGRWSASSSRFEVETMLCLSCSRSHRKPEIGAPMCIFLQAKGAASGGTQRLGIILAGLQPKFPKSAA